MIGIIYMFDLCNNNSFASIDKWIKECKKSGGEKLLPCIFGNKINKEVEVSTSEIKKFCNFNKIDYYEVSSEKIETIKLSVNSFLLKIIESKL